MKLVMDEKLKHRLVGVSVILSLAAIFLPAMMKKSSQRLENHFSVNVQLPPKPEAPDVAMTDEDQMFKTIKVSKVKLLPATKEIPTADLQKEDFIASAPIAENAVMAAAKVESAPESIEKPLELALNNAAQTAVKKEIKVAASSPTSVKPVKVAALQAVKTKVNPRPSVAKVVAKTAAKPVMRRDVYAVQLASFSKLSNAQSLVNKLQRKGYKANYTRVANRSGVIYKVYVGNSPTRVHAEKLKVQLASAMQLNGFVVNTGVS